MLVAAFWLDGRHLRYRFTLFSCVGMDNLNQWIDDRQSFERARHPQKKKSLPSRVSPFYTRRSALRLARCSKVPVIGSLSGSRLDSPSRPLTVPLLAPFLLAAGVFPCAAFFPWPCGTG